MLTTIEQVKEITGYDVDNPLINQAQTIIESFVGRTEIDVIDPRDQMLLARAVAYQSAYMQHQGEVIFEQMRVAGLTNFGQVVQFKSGDEYSPYVSPLAVLACKSLSWKRLRSIKIGPTFPRTPLADRWERE